MTAFARLTIVNTRITEQSDNFGVNGGEFASINSDFLLYSRFIQKNTSYDTDFSVLPLDNSPYFCYTIYLKKYRFFTENFVWKRSSSLAELWTSWRPTFSLGII